MTTNATVEARHEKAAADIGAAPWLDVVAEMAQHLANLEAARAEIASLRDYITTPSPCPDCAAKDAEIAIWQGKAETFGRACSEKDEAITKAMDLGVTEEAWDVLKPYRTPPADPLAEALKAALYECFGFRDDGGGPALIDALAKRGLELSRLGGAK